jgi:hypothetical protein
VITLDNAGDLASAVVALAALIVAVISLVRTNKYAKTTDRLNRLLIDRASADAITKQQADLSANLYEYGKRKYALKVFNRGKGVARNVRLIDLDSKEDTILLSSDVSLRFPVPILEQHQSVELIASIHFGLPRLRAHIKLLWDDQTGSDHEKELTPSL